MKLMLTENKKKLRGLNNNHGMALLTTFIVITVLLVLGVGIIGLVASNANQTTYADTSERLYYTAEGGAQQAIEQLKRATVSCYNDLGQDRLTSAANYNTNKGKFFGDDSDKYSILRRAFGARAASGQFEFIAVGLGFDTKSTITMSDGPDANSKLFTVISTATSGTTQKQATASILIHRADVTFLQTQVRLDSSPDSFWDLFSSDYHYRNAALFLGGTLDFSGLPASPVLADLKSKYQPVISLGRLIPASAGQLRTSYDIGTSYDSVEEDYGSTNTTKTLDFLNWYIEYSMLYNDGDDSKESSYKAAYALADTYPGAVNPSAKHSLLDATTGQAMKVPNDGIVTPAGLYQNMLNPVTGVTELTLNPAFLIKPSDYPNSSQPSVNRRLYLVGESRPHAASKVSFTMKDFSYNYDKITDAYIYCDGDLTIERCLLQKAFIHCTGNLYITNSELVGSTVYCDGNIIITNDSSSNSYSAWRVILTAFWSYITTGSGGDYLSENPNLIYSKYDTTFNNNNLNGYYYVGRDLYANKGDMSARPASIVYVNRNILFSPLGEAYRYKGMIYSFGNVSVEGPTTIYGQVAARGNMSIARSTNSNVKLTVDYGFSTTIVSEIEDLFGSSTRFSQSNFSKAVYITAAVPQVVIPKNAEIFTSETSVKPK